MNKLVFLIVAFLVVPSFAGCLEPEDKRTIIKEATPFDFETPLPITTYYHFDGALNASEYYEMNGTSVLYGNNVPIFSHGTYYGIGTTTFEPTLGVTLQDNVYMTSWGTGSGGATAIIQCSNLVTMTNLSDYS
jgi:hypothetical protein